MSNTETSRRPGTQSAAFPEGLGKVVLIGMTVGVIVVPLIVYFSMDIFGTFGPACTVGGAGDHIACSMRQIIMTGMAVPVGALLGFLGAYWICCRRFNASQ